MSEISIHTITGAHDVEVADLNGWEYLIIEMPVEVEWDWEVPSPATMYEPPAGGWSIIGTSYPNPAVVNVYDEEGELRDVVEMYFENLSDQFQQAIEKSVNDRAVPPT